MTSVMVFTLTSRRSCGGGGSRRRHLSKVQGHTPPAPRHWERERDRYIEAWRVRWASAGSGDTGPTARRSRAPATVRPHAIGRRPHASEHTSRADPISRIWVKWPRPGSATGATFRASTVSLPLQHTLLLYTSLYYSGWFSPTLWSIHSPVKPHKVRLMFVVIHSVLIIIKITENFKIYF